MTRDDIEFQWGQCHSLNYLQRVNRQVADLLFPDRRPETMFLKMYEEVGEVVGSPNSAEELADVFIMLLDHADRMGFDIGLEILLKLEKNLNRQWKIDPVTGVAKHLKESR